jgi:hypothetical protein
MMHNNGQQVYRTHDFRAPPMQPMQPPMQQQPMQQQPMQQQPMQQQMQQQMQPPPPLMPPMPARQATCGASAMSGLAIKQEPEPGYRPRSIGRNVPPEDIDPEDLEAAKEVVAKLVAEPWRRLQITIEDEAKKKRFHDAAQTLWSVRMFHSRDPEDIRVFDAAGCHVRPACVDLFPDSLKELTSVCPGMTVMPQPKDTQVHRLYYGFDFYGGANFWAVATVDIELRKYGFDVVNVNRVGFRMIENAKPGDQARYERELKAGLYAYNKDLFKRNKELRSAIGKKPSKQDADLRKKALKCLMHEAEARAWDTEGVCDFSQARARE